MRMHHTPSHWILVVLVLIALLFVLSEAHGQGTSANAVFEGQPALAGAQGGLGAQAGPPQGGLGVQGNEAAERTMHLRRPPNTSGSNPTTATTPPAAAATTDVAVARAADHKIVPRDTGVASNHRGIVRKTRRAIRHTVRQARTGTPQIDGTTAAAR